MPTPATHLWRPSNARLVVLDDSVPTPRGTAPVVPPLLVWPVKGPSDVLDYQLDLTAAIAGDEGDGIATLDVTISPANPGDLTLNSSSADGSRAVLWLAGGVAGTIYTVTLSIGLQSGRLLARSVLLPVLPLSSPPATLAALLASAGLPLTDQNGNPILVAAVTP